jgi:hypothetical protein
MENAITFSAKQEDGITRKCYTQKMLYPENAKTKHNEAKIQGRQ